jgi:hypothetical protein
MRVDGEWKPGRWANAVQYEAVALGVFFVRPSFQWLGESVGSENIFMRCLDALVRGLVERSH